MTVKELIDKLGTLPYDMEVFRWEDGGYDNPVYIPMEIDTWKPCVMSLTYKHYNEDGFEWDEVNVDNNGTDCLVI